jgi:hypothetical protein
MSQHFDLIVIGSGPAGRRDAEHCLKVLAPGACHKPALVGRMGDLVQVAADAPKLTEGVLEGQ